MGLRVLAGASGPMRSVWCRSTARLIRRRIVQASATRPSWHPHRKPSYMEPLSPPA